jgi:hypothetical protein
MQSLQNQTASGRFFYCRIRQLTAILTALPARALKATHSAPIVIKQKR